MAHRLAVASRKLHHSRLVPENRPARAVRRRVDSQDCHPVASVDEHEAQCLDKSALPCAWRARNSEAEAGEEAAGGLVPPRASFPSLAEHGVH